MNKYYKKTDLVCDECGGQIVMDTSKGEHYCLQCSLVFESEPLTRLIKKIIEERRNIK